MAEVAQEKKKLFPVDDKIHTWPHLTRNEFLCALFVVVVLTLWASLIDAPLESPANPTRTPNPSKAPWYFLGLQEMLVYFDPWNAGVVMPSLIIVESYGDSVYRYQSQRQRLLHLQRQKIRNPNFFPGLSRPMGRDDLDRDIFSRVSRLATFLAVAALGPAQGRLR